MLIIDQVVKLGTYYSAQYHSTPYAVCQRRSQLKAESIRQSSSITTTAASLQQVPLFCHLPTLSTISGSRLSSRSYCSCRLSSEDTTSSIVFPVVRPYLCLDNVTIQTTSNDCLDWCCDHRHLEHDSSFHTKEREASSNEQGIHGRNRQSAYLEASS